MNHHPDFPPFMTEKMPIDKALDALGFVKTEEIGYSREWDGVAFDASESFLGWCLIFGGHISRREMIEPFPIHIPSEIAPIDLMATIYKYWAMAYPNKDPNELSLIWGKEWIDYKKELRQLIPDVPTVWADREFFRYCLSFIEKRIDWDKADYDIEFSFENGQLKIVAQDIALFCPSFGQLIGTTKASARQLFRRIPKRFLGGLVSINSDGKKLLIDSCELDATWSDDSDEHPSN